MRLSIIFFIFFPNFNLSSHAKTEMYRCIHERARWRGERQREREEMLSFRFDGVRRRRLSMARLTQLQQSQQCPNSTVSITMRQKSSVILATSSGREGEEEG